MKSIVKSLLLVLTLFISAPIAQEADAEGYRKPVMVIRFDGPYTEYEKSLSLVVRAAVQKKKDVIFDISAGGQAQAEGGQVVNSIRRMGVDRTHITLSYSGYNNNEVLIFVR